jgi:DNA-directed RNA polymerase subunit M/transcription elongation factor TFIIS
MKFCKECNNLLYIKQAFDDFQYFCKKCNYNEKIESEKDYMVYSKNHQGYIVCDDIVEYSSLCNDISLPRIQAKCIKCNKDSNIVLYKCSDLTIVNICCLCNHFWKN